MTRAAWKGPVVLNTLNCVFEKKEIDSYYVKQKNFFITSNLIYKILYVYNGVEYKKLFILPEMVGFRVGEFITTKKRCVYKPKKKKSK